MAEARIDPGTLELKDRVVAINRVAKVVKGGRRFSFTALVVVGDGAGHVGIGLGKAHEVPEAIRKAVESYPEDLKVAMVGTGGLSHQMIGERAGFNDEKWDREFLDLIERDPERLAGMTVEDFMARGGNEGAEVIMWLIMRGALAPNARKLHQNYYLPMTTAMAVALFE